MSLQPPQGAHEPHKSKAYLSDDFRQDVIDAWAILWSGGRLQRSTATQLLSRLRDLGQPHPPYEPTGKESSQPIIESGTRTLPWIQQARKTCDRQQEWASTEHTAFKQFQTQVGKLSTSSPTGVKQVLKVYADTVASLDHFDSSPEAFKENMTNDLNPDLVTHILRGGTLSPPIKQSILDTISKTIQQRKAIVNGIDRERTQIDSIAERLVQVDRQRASACELLLDMDDVTAPELLSDCYDRFDKYQDTVTDLANERRTQILSQQVVHGVPRTETTVTFSSVPIEGTKAYPWFYALLYANSQPIDPILGAIAQVSTRLHRVQMAINSLGSCTAGTLAASATRYQSP